MERVFSRRLINSLLLSILCTNMGDSILYILVIWIYNNDNVSPIILASIFTVTSIIDATSFLWGPVIDNSVPYKTLFKTSSLQTLMIFFCVLAIVLEINGSNYFILMSFIIIYILSTIIYPSAKKVIPCLVEDNRLIETNSFFQTCVKVMDVMFNALSAVIISHIERRYLMIIVLIIFTMASLQYFFVSKYVIYNCEKISENLSSNYFFELKKGIHEILYHKEVMMFFVPISIVNFFYGVAITGLPVFSRKYITDGPSGYGGLLFASSLGGIAGTYIVRKIKLEKYDISCLLCMMLTIAGGAWLGMAITIKYCCILAYIFIFFNNGSINMMNIIFVSLLQKNISFDLLGRVSTFTESFAYVMIPLGNFIGGCLLLTHDSILLEEMYGVALIFCALLYLMPSKNMNKKN